MNENQIQAYGQNADSDQLFVQIAEGISDAYSAHVRTFTSWLQDSGSGNLLQSVAEYFRQLNQSQLSASTIRCKRQAVKHRLRLIADQTSRTPDQQYRLDLALRRLDSDADTKAPKVGSKAVSASKVLTDSEYDTLLVRSRSGRQRCFVRFLWNTGCRVSELCGIRLDDCKPEGKVVQIRVMGKGRKERFVRITADLFAEIQRVFSGSVFLFETTGGKPYRRCYVSDQIAKLTEYAIGRKMSAHKLRHSFATRTIAKTHKISAVSEYLGHSNVSVTLGMYNHEQLTDADLFGAEAVS